MEERHSDRFNWPIEDRPNIAVAHQRRLNPTATRCHNSVVRAGQCASASAARATSLSESN